MKPLKNATAGSTTHSIAPILSNQAKLATNIASQQKELLPTSNLDKPQKSTNLASTSKYLSKAAPASR